MTVGPNQKGVKPTGFQCSLERKKGAQCPGHYSVGGPLVLCYAIFCVPLSEIVIKSNGCAAAGETARQRVEKGVVVVLPVKINNRERHHVSVFVYVVLCLCRSYVYVYEGIQASKKARLHQVPQTIG